MKNRLAFLLSSIVKWVRTKLPPPTNPAISPEEFRKMLAEAMSEPETRRLLLRSFVTHFPFQGGACGTPAWEVSNGTFGSECPGGQDTNPYGFARDVRIGFDFQGTNRILKTFTTLHALANVPSQLEVGIADGGGTVGMIVKNLRDGSFNSQHLEFVTHHGNVSVGTRMTIDKDGKVGIGTTSPASLLSVSYNNSAYGTAGIELDSQNGSGQAVVSLKTNASERARIRADYVGNLVMSAINGSLLFNNDSSGGEAMRITSGNVGIGTTDPSNKLHVVGDVRIGTPGTPDNVLNTLLFGASAPKQQSFGPEMITAASEAPLANRRVVLWAGKAADAEAMHLINSTGFLEWGPGGSGAFADQDSGLRREPRTPSPSEPAALGNMLLTTNGAFQVVRADPDNFNARLDVNAGPMSKGFLTSNGTNVTDGSGNKTVIIGSITYRFKTTLAAAYDVKIGANAAATLNNLKLAINAQGTEGTNYGTGTLANPDATVPPAYINDTTGLVFRVDGKVAGVVVAASTNESTLTWSGLTSGNLGSPIPYMVGINVPPGGGTGALDVRYIGTDPTIRASQSTAGAIIFGGYVHPPGQNPDQQLRFVVSADGTLSWGPGGSSTPDTSLYRSAASTLNTPGNLVVGGNLTVTGSVSKGSGSFKIDHPLDAANKYLSHSFVESPDMMNVYNGNIVLDDQGEAWIALPEWFEALNRDFRYQLTAIGGPGPNLYVAHEIEGIRFQIAGGKPGLKVSWQVTGIRQDPYAEAHRIKVEEDKPEREHGLYLHPELYSQPKEKGIEYAHRPTEPPPSKNSGKDSGAAAWLRNPSIRRNADATRELN